MFPRFPVLKAMSAFALFASLLSAAACTNRSTMPAPIPAIGLQTTAREKADGCPTILVISPSPSFLDLRGHVLLSDALEKQKQFYRCEVVSKTHPPAHWKTSTGSLRIDDGGRKAIFSASESGVYSVTATFAKYRAESTVVAQPDNEWVLATNVHTPNGGLLVGNDGALFGVSYSGYVFKLDRGASSAKRIYSFHGGHSGEFPFGALVTDKQGDLFGTTAEGGIGFGSNTCCGTVYELKRSGAQYQERVIFRFRTRGTGVAPYTGVVADRHGALYGLTSDGVVYKLATHGSSYVYSIVHRFKVGPSCSAHPSPDSPGLVLSSNDVLYGALPGAGAGCGIVFELVPNGTSYSEKTIYVFTGGKDGSDPNSVIVDSTGNVFGTTAVGGSGNGTVFELVARGVSFAKHTLYSFSGATDGAVPVGLTMGLHGVIYGAAFGGGVGGQGTVFALTPNGATYIERTVHIFGKPGDAGLPNEPLTSDTGGTLYGVTYYQNPSVYKVKP